MPEVSFLILDDGRHPPEPTPCVARKGAPPEAADVMTQLKSLYFEKIRCVSCARLACVE